jgi:site-specific DNA-cytosine methylase
MGSCLGASQNFLCLHTIRNQVIEETIFHFTGPYMLPKVTETVREQRPTMVVLENVVGLKRVIDDVMAELNSIHGYFTMHIDIDPYTLGCPTARPRIYILMISRASLIDGSDDAFQVQAENVLKAVWPVIIGVTPPL